MGEFQCYDRRALASLAAAAQEAGHPEWGYMGPHDAGHYNSMPEVGPPPPGDEPAAKPTRSVSLEARDACSAFTSREMEAAGKDSLRPAAHVQ